MLKSGQARKACSFSLICFVLCLCLYTSVDGQAQCGLSHLVLGNICARTFSVNSRKRLQVEEAYRDWLCGMTMPFFWKGQRIEPCNATEYLLSFCDNVAKKCPYFLPQLDGQYAGEPSFSCTAATTHTYAEGLASMYLPSASDGASADLSKPCYFRCADSNSMTQNEHAPCVRPSQPPDNDTASHHAKDRGSNQQLLRSSSQKSSSSSAEISDNSSSSSSSPSSSSSVASSAASSLRHTGGAAAILTCYVTPCWTSLGFVARVIALWIIRTLSYIALLQLGSVL